MTKDERRCTGSRGSDSLGSGRWAFQHPLVLSASQWWPGFQLLLASGPPLKQTRDSIRPLAGSQPSLPLSSQPQAHVTGPRKQKLLLKGIPGPTLTKKAATLVTAGSSTEGKGAHGHGHHPSLPGAWLSPASRSNCASSCPLSISIEDKGSVDSAAQERPGIFSHEKRCWRPSWWEREEQCGRD